MHYYLPGITKSTSWVIAGYTIVHGITSDRLYLNNEAEYHQIINVIHDVLATKKTTRFDNVSRKLVHASPPTGYY